MNSVMVQEPSSVAAVSDLDLGGIEHLAEFPNWLRILVGAYPESWANEATYMVLISKFARYDDDVMEMATDLYIEAELKFPSPAALRPYVMRFAPRDLHAGFLASMTRAGYRFISDEDHVMTFESIQTGLLATVIH